MYKIKVEKSIPKKFFLHNLKNHQFSITKNTEKDCPPPSIFIRYHHHLRKDKLLKKRRKQGKTEEEDKKGKLTN